NTDPANPNEFDWTAPQFRQKGNTLFPINLAGNAPLYGLASKFRISSSTAELDLAQFDPVHVTLLGDYAVNHGFDRREIFQRTGAATSRRGSLRVSCAPRSATVRSSGAETGSPSGATSCCSATRCSTHSTTATSTSAAPTLRAGSSAAAGASTATPVSAPSPPPRTRSTARRWRSTSS